MKKALVGRKIGMTQYIKEDGVVIPVTVCEVGPCVVIGKKTIEKDGYSAMRLGFMDQKDKRVNKSILDDLKKKGITAKKFIREVDDFDESLAVGSEIKCSIFAEDDLVNITGVSKGRGFAGVIKRYGFSGGRATHGSHFHRSPGSIGACAYPGEVWKGKKMPGRLGSNQVTVKNLKVVKVFEEDNIILISGAVPGTRNSLIKIREK